MPGIGSLPAASPSAGAEILPRPNQAPRRSRRFQRKRVGRESALDGSEEPASSSSAWKSSAPPCAGRAQTSSRVKSGTISWMRQGRDSCVGVREPHVDPPIHTLSYGSLGSPLASVNTVPYRYADGQGPDSTRRLDRRGAAGAGGRRPGRRPGRGAGRVPRGLQGRLLLALQGSPGAARRDARHLGEERSSRTSSPRSRASRATRGRSCSTSSSWPPPRRPFAVELALRDWSRRDSEVADAAAPGRQPAHGVPALAVRAVLRRRGRRRGPQHARLLALHRQLLHRSPSIRAGAGARCCSSRSTACSASRGANDDRRDRPRYVIAATGRTGEVEVGQGVDGDVGKGGDRLAVGPLDLARLLRPGVEDDGGDLEAGGAGGLDRQQGVVDRAEAGARRRSPAGSRGRRRGRGRGRRGRAGPAGRRRPRRRARRRPSAAARAACAQALRVDLLAGQRRGEVGRGRRPVAVGGDLARRSGSSRRRGAAARGRSRPPRRGR